MKQAVGGSPKC